MHPRTFWCLVLFYLARSATLVAVCYWFPEAALILLIFYAIKREMPYDLIP